MMMKQSSSSPSEHIANYLADNAAPSMLDLDQNGRFECCRGIDAGMAGVFSLLQHTFQCVMLHALAVGDQLIDRGLALHRA